MDKRTLIVTAAALSVAFSTGSVQAQTPTNDSRPASSIISRDVTVESGDTLASLSRRELGRAGYAPQLAEFNDLVPGAPLITGDIVRIPINVPARGESAIVIFAKGTASISRMDSTAPRVTAAAGRNTAFEPTIITLQRDVEVLSGDVITTGADGYVSIEFSSGSIINLQPDTEATLSRLNCLAADDSCVIEIDTAHGKVTSDVDTRDNQPVDFRITTPYASAAVRGTVFDIDAAESLLVGVTDGNVDVSAMQQTVALPQGFGSIVEEGQVPSEPVPLLPPPVFKRVPARLAPSDALTWWPLTGAEAYNALVALDEAGNETVSSFAVSADRAGVSGVAPGDYFLHLRAVDENGLQGFLSNTRITVAEIDPGISAVTTSVTRQGNEFLVEILDPPLTAGGFEIQIDSNEDFSDPLSVDVDPNGVAIFRLDSDLVYTRARAILDPYTVSVYGEPSSSGN